VIAVLARVLVYIIIIIIMLHTRIWKMYLHSTLHLHTRSTRQNRGDF